MQRADHACRDGRLEPERVADRDHQLTDPEPPRLAERGGRQAAARKAQESEVSIGILAHDPGLDAGAVGENGIQPRGAAHHMIVGQHVAVGGDDHPGAGPQHGRKGILGVVFAPAPANADHRRSDPLRDVDDAPRERVEQTGVVDLRLARRFRRLLAPQTVTDQPQQDPVLSRHRRNAA
jgi:hypothetical protein